MRMILPIDAFGDNYIWLVSDSSKKYCIVVDPGESQPVVDALEKHDMKLAGILITHHHMDHTGGTPELALRYKVPVYGSGKEKVKGLTNPLKDNDNISVDKMDISFRVIETPGHTSGHLLFYAEDSGSRYLFTGDTLFPSGCGRVFDGTPQQMYKSLMRIRELPEDTLIFPGHEYTLENLEFATLVEPANNDIKERIKSVTVKLDSDEPAIISTIAIELKTNPFLRCDKRDVKKMAEKYSGETLKSDSEVFRVLRSWKNVF